MFSFKKMILLSLFVIILIITKISACNGNQVSSRKKLISTETEVCAEKGKECQYNWDCCRGYKCNHAQTKFTINHVTSRTGECIDAYNMYG